jgi:hypothetical protein
MSMSILGATLNLYRNVGEATFRSVAKSLWAIAFLFGAFAVIHGVSLALGGTGLVGGLVAYVVYASLAGWYLSLIEIAVVTGRGVTTDDIRDNMGQYAQDAISVMFIFFVPQLLIGWASPQALLVLVPAACLAFNPVPEMLYQERSVGIELIGDAAMFMQQNWPEWLGPHLVAGALFAMLGWSMTGVWDPIWMLEAVQMFGPWFGFMRAGLWGIGLGGGFTPVGFGLFAVVFAFTHCFMVFRGHLYKRLRTSSRRGRAWQAQL